MNSSVAPGRNIAIWKRFSFRRLHASDDADLDRSRSCSLPSWYRLRQPILVVGVLITLNALAVRADAARYGVTPSPQLAVNRGVVELETGRGSGISVQMAEDLANLIDDGATRRVLPVVGKGGLKNITDLELLRGIDLTILQDDVMNYARQQNLSPEIQVPDYLYC